MFKRMDQSSKEDWDHIYNEHLPHVLDMPNRIISMLKELGVLHLVLEQINCTMLCRQQLWQRKAGASDEMVLISLIHDMGKVINVPNHGQIIMQKLLNHMSLLMLTTLSKHIKISRGNIIIIIRASHAIYESNTLMNHGMKKLLNLQINGIRLHLILNIKLIHWNHLNH